MILASTLLLSFASAVSGSFHGDFGSCAPGLVFCLESFECVPDGLGPMLEHPVTCRHDEIFCVESGRCVPADADDEWWEGDEEGVCGGDTILCLETLQCVPRDCGEAPRPTGVPSARTTSLEPLDEIPDVAATPPPKKDNNAPQRSGVATTEPPKSGSGVGKTSPPPKVGRTEKPQESDVGPTDKPRANAPTTARVRVTTTRPRSGTRRTSTKPALATRQQHVQATQTDAPEQPPPAPPGVVFVSFVLIWMWGCCVILRPETSVSDAVGNALGAIGKRFGGAFRSIF